MLQALCWPTVQIALSKHCCPSVLHHEYNMIDSANVCDFSSFDALKESCTVNFLEVYPIY